MKKIIKNSIAPLLILLGGSTLASTLIINNPTVNIKENTSLKINLSQDILVNNKADIIMSSKEVAVVVKAKLAADPDWNGALISSDFPPGVTIIGSGAFSNVIPEIDRIKSIVFPDTVKTFEKISFIGNSSIRTISATGVTSIGVLAFFDMTSITKVNLTKSANVDVSKWEQWGLASADSLNIIDPSPPINPGTGTDDSTMWIIIGSSVGGALLIGGIITAIVISRKKSANISSIKPKSINSYSNEDDDIELETKI